MTYPVHRIVPFACVECGAVMHQPADDENRLCLNCRYPIPSEGLATEPAGPETDLLDQGHAKADMEDHRHTRFIDLDECDPILVVKRL